MSERDWYQGVPSSTTVLILGEVFEDRPPVTVALQFGRQAYETYQTTVYLESLLKTRHDPTYVDWSPLFCSLYAGIIATGARRVVELGSTLFATVDKLAKLQRLSTGPSIADVEFIGVEPVLSSHLVRPEDDGATGRPLRGLGVRMPRDLVLA